ncbi:MAG: metalloregulator ArsR/SmtB family transcription factor [SAR324 cluster bacterium]|nr:metalloregulator ArsR/SmtB family transcription factor [SAR324 cluster bacterium]
MLEIVNALKLLGDDTRLRILRVVAREPLNVSEITAILGLAQSGISRHLSLLRKAGLVEERREGVWSYYQLASPLRLGEGWEGSQESNGGGEEPLDAELRQVWEFVQHRLGEAEDPFHDLPRLTEALRQRENYGGGLNEKLLEPGQSWFAWSRALHYLLPALDAIDLGCGDGTITVELSRFARKVVGIDIDPKALVAARRRAEREHRENVTFKEDRIENLREPDQSFDLAVFSQSLHHLKEPEAGLRHGQRVLRPGGRLVVFDLAPHQERWVIPKLGHVHLGFAPEELERMLRGSGLVEVKLEQVLQRRGEVFRVVLASGLKAKH